MEQLSLFAPDYEDSAVTGKPLSDEPVRMRVLITVKAAPNPSERYGETVCVAGIRIDPEHSGWVRLYPVNFRELDDEGRFKKYDIVSVEARPSRGDSRVESWRPRMDTLMTHRNLGTWKRRFPYISDHIADSMCGVLAAVRESPPARSLAAIRPRRVMDLQIEPHPGWNSDERAKIDRYVRQLELPGLVRSPKRALEAPRFRGWYQYQCASLRCKGHRQGIYDWEWVALQRHLADRDDDAAVQALRTRFLDQICAPENDLIFYVGNQAKHQHSFMILGAFYPRR